MIEALYKVCAYDELTEDGKGIHFAVHISVRASSEEEAISEAKKYVTRKTYRVVDVSTFALSSLAVGMEKAIAIRDLARALYSIGEKEEKKS